MTQAQALSILKTGASVFLTGEPGAGKTHTINEYVSYLRKHGIEPAITASTGIAATHIHGQTIHSWSGIGIRSTLSPYDLDTLATTEYLVRRVRKTAVLIIDEISMLEATMFGLVDLVCRTIRQIDEPFGGIQVVLVGDFFQLPPIAKPGARAQFAFESPAWKALSPIVCYLSEQHRQDDRAYHELLRTIRSGVYEDIPIEMLEDRVGRDVITYDHDPLTKLFPHNQDVDAINQAELRALPGIEQRYTMTSKGKESLVASLKKGCLSPEELELKVGALVMCTKNNQPKGYVNGTLGTVVAFETGTKYPIIETRDMERIVIEPVEWSIEEDGKQKARITQVPLRLAWAITIHKSQGMSLDRALMDLSQVFEYGQGYVALSRVKSLSGLHLLGWNNRAFEVHPTIRSIDGTFRTQSEGAAVLFGDIPKDELETMHHNFIRARGGVINPKPPRRAKIRTKSL